MSIQLGHLEGPLGTVATGVDLRRPLDADDQAAVRPRRPAPRRLPGSAPRPRRRALLRGFARPALAPPGRGRGSGRRVGGARQPSHPRRRAPGRRLARRRDVRRRVARLHDPVGAGRPPPRRRDRWRRCGPSTSTGRQQCQRARWLTGATHRLVPVDPVTGRRSLFVNPGFTRRFENLSPLARRPGLRYLSSPCTRPCAGTTTGPLATSWCGTTGPCCTAPTTTSGTRPGSWPA